MRLKTNLTKFVCKCCGKTMQFLPYELRKNHGFCSIRCSKMGKFNPNYKDITEVGYAPLHRKMWKEIPKPLNCTKCGDRKPCDLSNISGEYRTAVNDWEWLCRKCHMLNDGRLKNLRKGLSDDVERDGETGRFKAKEPCGTILA